MARTGRMTQSGAHPFMGKLTFAEAQAIRRRHAAGESLRALGLEYGVSAQAVHRVVLGQVHRRPPTASAETEEKRTPCPVAAGQGAEERSNVQAERYTRGPTAAT